MKKILVVFCVIVFIFAQNLDIFAASNAPFWSAVAASLSAVTAVMTYNFNSGKSKKKLKSDLCNTMIHLGGLINYVQVIYQYHNLITVNVTNDRNAFDDDNRAAIESAGRIVNHIIDLNQTNSQFFDTEQAFLYNGQFNEKLIAELGALVEQCLGMNAFRIIQCEEVFLMLNMFLMREAKALNILREINEYYGDDPEIEYIFQRTCNHIEEIEENCEEKTNDSQYIGNNLSTLFDMPELRITNERDDWEFIKNRIVYKCFYLFLVGNNRYDTVIYRYTNVIRFIFEIDISSCRIDVNRTYFLLPTGENIRIQDIRNFFEDYNTIVYNPAENR